jgi:hypothetical protein
MNKDRVSNTNDGKCLIKDGMKTKGVNQIPAKSKVARAVLLAPTKFLVKSLNPKLLNSAITL